MAKSTCLLALFVVFVVCVEAIRIDPARPPPGRSGIYTHPIRKNDPRCRNGNGLFPDLNDCTKYIKCVNGDSQMRKCPEDFKFDSIRHCILPGDNPDCGRRALHSTSDEYEKCPETYGIFPVKSDCHKYMICRDGVPTVKSCPERHVYRDINGGCVDGDKCPTPRAEEVECKRANQLLPDPKNCRRYVKCINFQPLIKECRPGTAFDPRKRRCTEEELEKCKNNDILNVGQDE